MRDKPELMREMILKANDSECFAVVYDRDNFCQDSVPTEYIEKTCAWLEERYCAVVSYRYVDSNGVTVETYRLLDGDTMFCRMLDYADRNWEFIGFMYGNPDVSSSKDETPVVSPEPLLPSTTPVQPTPIDDSQTYAPTDVD